jgi:hypothetical protein
MLNRFTNNKKLSAECSDMDRVTGSEMEARQLAIQLKQEILDRCQTA